MDKYSFSNETPNAKKVLELYKAVKFFNKYWSLERMEKVLENSSLLLCCYEGKKLIGIARGISDKYWVAHLSHLAVHPDYQNLGIGKALIQKIREDLGNAVTLMVHAGPGIGGYYKKLGFDLYENVYRIKRAQ